MPVELLTGLGPVSFRRLGVDPPSANYVTSDEFLNIRTVADHTGPVLLLRVRLLRPSGELVEIERSYRAGPIFMFGEWNIRLTQGFLLSVACTTDIILQRGRQWVKVELRHGEVTEVSPARVLISDYIAKAVPVSWPEGPLRSPFDGRGYMWNPIMAMPGAGNNLVMVVPIYAHWKVHSFHIRLVTNAVAGDRWFNIIMSLAGGNEFYCQSQQAQGPGLSQRYVCSTAFGSYYFSWIAHHLPLPKDMFLPGGARIRTSISNMKAGDNIDIGQALVEEWRSPF